MGARMGRAVGVALAFALALDCRDPTEITLHLSTDVPCDRGVVTRIVAGAASPPVTEACAKGEIGTLVLYPSGSVDAAVDIEVTLALGGERPEACAPRDIRCIVARRRLRYREHDDLVLDIQLRQVCAGVDCPSGFTCVDGACSSADVDNPGLQGDAGAGSSDARPDGTVEDSGAPDAGLDAIGDAIFDVNGGCAPNAALIATNGRVTGMSVTSSHLFWAVPSSPAEVASLPRDGGAKSAFPIVGSPNLVAGHGTTGGTGYWFDGSLTLHHHDVLDTTPSTDTSIVGLAALGSSALFTSPNAGGAVFAATSTSSSARAVATGFAEIGPITVYGKGSLAAFVADTLTLYKLVALDAGKPSPFLKVSTGGAGAPAIISLLDADDLGVYIGVQMTASDAGYQIYRSASTGATGSATLLYDASSVPAILTGLAMTSNGLAWAAQLATGGAAFYYVTPLPLAPPIKAPEQVALDAAGAIASDDDCIYYWGSDPRAGSAIRTHPP